MKKITAFFMAILPFVVVLILFATGLIVKDVKYVDVKSIEIINDSLVLQKPTLETAEYDFSTNIVINPSIATDPVIYYQSTDTNVLDFQGQATSTNGKATIKADGYKDDVTINCWAKAKPDDVKHFKFSCTNDKVLGIRADDLYMIANGTTNPEATTIPSTHVTSNLSYKLADTASEELITIDSKSGQINSKGKEGTAKVTITNTNTQDPSQTLSKDINVYVIPNINTLGFKDEATSVVTNSNTYNIFEHLSTQPTQVKEGDAVYFNYTSSDESIATVDANGLVTFKQPHKPVDIYVTFKADEYTIAKRTITSTMDNYADVTFNQYSYTANINELANDTKITDKIQYSTYPQSIAGKSATITSDNTNVVKVEGGEIYAVGPGTCNLTVTVDASATTKISDTMTVTILPGTSSEILNTKTVSLDKDFYYCLNKAVKDEFKDKNITWAITSGDAATLDSGVLHFVKTGTVTCSATIGSATATLTVEAKTEPEITKLDGTDEYTTQTIKAGQKFQFVDADGNVLAPTFDDATKLLIKDLGSNTFVANTGTKEVKNVTITLKDESTVTVPFVIQEDVVDIKATSDLDLWPNYSTNKEQIKVADKIAVYPTTATLEDGSLPTITYKYDVEDKESLVWPILDNTLQVLKPTTIKINTKINTIEKNYSIKSYAGLNGKFIMKDDAGIIQSGKTYELNIGDSKTITIDKFQLPDVDTSKEEILKKGFKFESLSGTGSVVNLGDIVYKNNTLEFTFTAKDKGEDVIAISNGSFTFYVNVKIANAKISKFDLYCNDQQVAATANAYSKNLTLTVDIEPMSASEIDYDVTANGNAISHANNTIILDDSNWSNDQCVLVISNKDKTVSSTYTLTYKDTTPSIKINEAYEEGGVKYLYSRAGVRYIAVSFSLQDNGLINKGYFQDKFQASGQDISGEIISNSLIITIPECTDDKPGFEGDIKVSSKSGDFEETYHISRDIVSRIELPNNDNTELSDMKGMQKVHVYGNKSFYAKEEGNVDYYKVDINLYDFRGNKITDLAKKEEAFKTLQMSTGKGTASYDAASGQIRYKFASGNENLYTFDEIYNNEFVSETKDQTINVATKWALHTFDLDRREQVNKSYNFVVVDGTNVFNQEGLQANHGEQASIVLQINFGLEKVTKENTPFTDWTLCRWKYVYGNGYTMNFDARTSYDKDKRPHEEGKNDFLTIGFENVINANIIGCNDSTFDNILKINKRKYNSIANPGSNATTHFAYCKFSNFYQVMTLWGASTNYIKNCVYNNDGAVCLSISDEGNHTYIEDTGFFKCSNVAIILQKKAGLYLKGDIQVYNFVKNDIFKDIGGHDLSFMWSMFEPILDKMGFLQWGADGQNHINAYCITLLPDDFYFWDPVDKKYYPSAEAIQSHKKYTNHLEKSIDVPILGGVSIWTTRKPNTDPTSPDYGCPSYYQEYDKDGNIKNDELINLINRLSRQISF